MTDPNPDQVRASLQHIQTADQITEQYQPYFHHGDGYAVATNGEASAELQPSEESRNA
jgi:hypothetical protein